MLAQTAWRPSGKNAPRVGETPSYWKHASSRPPARSQSLRVRSAKLLERAWRPSGDTATQKISDAWPSKSAQLAASGRVPQSGASDRRRRKGRECRRVGTRRN